MVSETRPAQPSGRNPLAELDSRIPTSFAIIEVFPAWHNAVGLAWVMVSFAVLAVVAIGFVARFLPETKGLSVEDAVEVFEQAATTKAPPGATPATAA
jgi:hypothetical protein